MEYPFFRINRRVFGFLFVGLVFLFVSLILLKIPPNMDESILYHPIACIDHPLSVYHQFREPCDGGFDLRIFGMQLPIRAYDYVGFASSLFYFSIYKLFPTYISARIMGCLSIVFLLFFARILSKASWILLAIIFGLNFPLVYQIINDTGPVGYPAILFFALPALFYFSFHQDKKGQVILGSVLGLLAFFGIEQKPFFLLLMPAVGLITLSLCGKRVFEKKSLLTIVPFMGVLVVLAGILLTGKIATGVTYFAHLTGMSEHWTASELAQYKYYAWQHFKNYYLNFQRFSHRNYIDFNSNLDWGYWLFWIASLGLIGWACYLFPKQRYKILIPVGVSVFLFLLICTNKKAAYGHHFIFSFLYFLFGLCLAIQVLQTRHRRAVTAFLVFCVCLNFATLGEVLKKDPVPESSWDRLSLLKFANAALAQSHVISHLDWGTYYIDALYGPKDKMVTYNEPLGNPAEIYKLMEISRKLNRKLAFICRKNTRSHWSLIESIVGPLHRVYPQENGANPPDKTPAQWEIWAESG